MTKIEFNRGFISAIALFLEHKDCWQIIKDKKTGKIISDLRLYAASDHLYNLVIPNNLSSQLKNMINKWQSECFKNRLETTSTKTDELFYEAENILVAIDKQIFEI